MQEPALKFIADAMLGRLAKRLRLKGFDVLYDPRMDDNVIIQRSLEEGRIILTRDTALASRPLASRCILLQSDRIDDQLDQLRTFLRSDEPPCALTRCSRCNVVLDEISREEARDQVPDHVFVTRTTFFRCRDCARVYWEGSHVKNMGLVPAQKKKGRSTRD